jgi:hypothetical protein
MICCKNNFLDNYLPLQEIKSLMKYLDPKNDLTFKKIFGQHPHLLKSFLNAMLPLPGDS